MKRVVLASILASVLLTFSSLGGMALFGMRGDMHMAPVVCADQVCAPTAHVVPTGTECLDHCLTVASVFNTVVAPLPFVALLIVFFSFLLFSSSFSFSFLSPQIIYRFREGIGKLLLRRQLATVVLRN